MRIRTLAAWLLGGAAYFGAAAAAFGPAPWWSADVLWAVCFFAIVYAAALALVVRGPRQAAGAAFAMASLLLLLCLHLEPTSLPTGRVVVALAASQPPPAPREARTLYARRELSAEDDVPVGLLGLWRSAAATAMPYAEQRQWLVRYRAANAVCVTAGGVVGGALGVLAQRRGRAGRVGV
jgi:hypothetical protein